MLIVGSPRMEDVSGDFLPRGRLAVMMETAAAVVKLAKNLVDILLWYGDVEENTSAVVVNLTKKFNDIFKRGLEIIVVRIVTIAIGSTLRGNIIIDDFSRQKFGIGV